jgi:hypothetical protein
VKEEPGAVEDARGGIGVGVGRCVGGQGVDVGEQGAPGGRVVPGGGQGGVQLGGGVGVGLVDEVVGGGEGRRGRG